MKLLAILLVVVACDKTAPPPQPPAVPDAPVRETLDLVVAIDLSKSMEETDLPPDRFEATKHAVRRLLLNVEADRVGIVIYAQRAAVREALTGDREALGDSVERLRIGDVPAIGTAMGDGLALAVEQLKGSQAKRKVIVLLADGETNMVARYDPAQAAALAKTAGVTVHTILVGSEATQDAGGMTADPKELQLVAKTTGGTFQRAIDTATFQKVLSSLLPMKATPVELPMPTGSRT